VYRKLSLRVLLLLVLSLFFISSCSLSFSDSIVNPSPVVEGKVLLFANESYLGGRLFRSPRTFSFRNNTFLGVGSYDSGWNARGFFSNVYLFWNGSSPRRVLLCARTPVEFQNVVLETVRARTRVFNGSNRSLLFPLSLFSSREQSFPVRVGEELVNYSFFQKKPGFLAGVRGGRLYCSPVVLPPATVWRGTLYYVTVGGVKWDLLVLDAFTNSLLTLLDPWTNQTRYSASFNSDVSSASQNLIVNDTLLMSVARAYYDFGEGSGSVLVDQWGVNNGTQTGMGYSSSYPSFNQSGSGAPYSGNFTAVSNERVVTNDFNNLFEDYNHTITGWARTDEKGGVLINKWNVGSPSQRTFVISVIPNGSFRVAYYTTSASLWDTDRIIDVGNVSGIGWFFFAVSNDVTSGVTKVYINGSLVASDSGGANSFRQTTTNVEIGGRSGGTSFNGTIDEMKIFGRVLSQEEIATLYNNGSWRYDDEYESISLNTTTEVREFNASWSGRKVTVNVSFDNGTSYVTASNNEWQNWSGSGNQTLKYLINFSNGGSIEDFNIFVKGYYQTPPSAPTEIKCDGGSCNNTFSGSVSMACNGSIDSQGDTITYILEKGNSSTSQGYTSFVEGWESGSISSDWSTYSSDANGRVIVTTVKAHSGSYSLLMDRSPNGVYTLNELITNFDMSGMTEVIIDFWHYDQSDEQHNGADHSGHYNGDAVYFSCDGSYWYLLQNLDQSTGGWYHVNINITTDPDWCGTTDENFKIKITQYDNYAYSTDGRLFDDINITYFGSVTTTNWTLIGNHTNGSVYTYDLSGEANETYEFLRCRAIDLGGSNSYSAYYVEDSNFTIVGGGDPCAYSGSGAWDLPCGCNITSNIDLGGNPIVISGSGVIRVEAAVTGVSYIQSPNTCGLSGDSSGYIEGET